MTGRTCETLDSLIDFSRVCMWQRCCQCETRQHFIFHQRRAWSVLLTLDAKRLEMSSSDKRAHPLVVSITVPGTVSSLPGPLLPLCLEIKMIYAKATGAALWGRWWDARRWSLEHWHGFLAGPVRRFWSSPGGAAAQGGMAWESWHLTWTGAGWARQGRSQGPPGSLYVCLCTLLASEAKLGRARATSM